MSRKIAPKTIVRMKSSNARWMLDHPDIYTAANRWTPKETEEFENEAYIHMLCCMGEPVYGLIMDISSLENTYKVLWAVGRHKTWYWVERKSFEVVK